MKRFPAKILLFGEYAVLKGGSALAIPFTKYGGEFTFEKAQSQKAFISNEKNKSYATWLQQQKNINWLKPESFKKDVEKGIWFNSDIPLNAGLGSSGALVAAVYERYSKEVIEDISELQKRLSKLESFFHGNSSGIDPLVSFSYSPILVNGFNTVKTIPEFKIPEEFSIFLLPNKGAGITAELVAKFNALYPGNENSFVKDYLPLNNILVENILNNTTDFWDSLKQISKAQLNYYSFIFDQNTQECFKQGIQNNNYLLKLCGSGGGGFILGFTKNKKLVTQQYSNCIWL